MPCGGIYPLSKDSDFYKMYNFEDPSHRCFQCGNVIHLDDLMFCIEWDCYLHRQCVPNFLNSEEGKVVIAHGHSVILYYEKEND